MRQLHTRMEKPFDESQMYPLTVEVGAGEGQHLPYVRHRFERYVLTDKRASGSTEQLPPGAEFMSADAQDLPFESGTVDRLVSTCVLHHLPDPEAALQSWRRVVRGNGVLTILLATDPGFAHRLGRHSPLEEPQ